MTLSFQAGLEATFQKVYYQNSLKTIRIALWFGIAIYSLFAGLDIMMAPNKLEFLWLIRFTIVCPFLVILIILSYFQVFIKIYQYCITAAVVVCGTGIIIMVTVLPSPANHTYYAGLMLVLIWGYTFTRIRFIWATLGGWMLVVLYEFVATQYLKSPLPILVNNNFFFVSANLVGMSACYILERYARQDFIQGILLRKREIANHRLKSIIVKRTSQLSAKNKELSEEIEERKWAEKRRAELESKLGAAQKMEALGTLAGGIAHDFNNLLMAIQGNTSLILATAPSNQRHCEKLKNIEEYVKRGSQLTRQLLGFARRGKYEARPTNLNPLITECVKLFGRTNKDVSVHFDFEDKPWTVKVDRGQIEQVLLNLFVNAWQAMPGGGTLFIETRNITMDENRVKGLGAKPGKYVKTSVIDEGIGMDETTIQRIFDPFFTTKEIGRGTGMGLASAYGILKSHEGFFEVQSKVGQGSTLSFYLPACSETIVDKYPKIIKKIVKGNGTILLVDDEKTILTVASELLESLGYSVLVAQSGQQAIEIYQNQRDRIDLVILDMIMPGLNGGKTFDRLKRENPKIKVLLSSGYSLSGEAMAIMEKGCVGFIQKPYDLFKLSRKVQDVLSCASASQSKTKDKLKDEKPSAINI